MVRRINHLRRFASIIRLFTHITLGLYLVGGFITSFVIAASGLAASYAYSMTPSNGFTAGGVIAALMIFIPYAALATLCCSLFYGLAEVFVYMADSTYNQLQGLRRASTSSAGIPRNTSRPRGRFVYDDDYSEYGY